MAVFVIGPTTATPRVSLIGSSVYISTQTWTTAGVLGTPGTSITIEIKNVDGSIQTAFTAMSAGTTGSYSYVFSTSTATPPGAYDVWIRTVDGGVTTTERYPALFEIAGMSS